MGLRPGGAHAQNVSHLDEGHTEAGQRGEKAQHPQGLPSNGVQVSSHNP